MNIKLEKNENNLVIEIYGISIRKFNQKPENSAQRTRKLI